MKETLEKYIQVIYYLSRHNAEVRSIDVGNILGVNRPDVSRAIKIMRQNGYIDQKPYGRIVLTEKGEEFAIKTVKIHRIILDIMTAKFELDPTEAEENACNIEHVMTDIAKERLIEIYDNKLKK